MLFLPNNYQLHPLPSLANRLVGWWGFDDGPVAVDYSGVSFANGILHNGPVPSAGFAKPVTAGKRRGSMRFTRSASTYVEVPKAVVTAGDLTFAIWVYRLSLNPNLNQTVMQLSAPNGSARNNFYISFGGANGEVLSIIQFNNTVFEHIDATINVNVGAWTHLAATYVSSTGVGAIYINGVSAVSGSLGATGYGPVTFTLTEIGATYDCTNNTFADFFDGFIDDARIYNRALSQPEILALATFPFQPDFLDVVGPSSPPLPIMGQIWI